MSANAARTGYAGAPVPRATYRLQLHADFTFRDASAIVPYLAKLGVSHVYCSPYLRARPGSRHGYDVVDHNSINPEIGSRADLNDFVATLRAHGMGHLLDFVPNHVGIMGADNAWWNDVLENGKASRYADFFDIDWSPPNVALANRLLVPALGDPYGTVLEQGQLRLSFEADTGSLAVRYFQHRFPLDPRSYAIVLSRAAADCAAGRVAGHRLLELATRLRGLPDRDNCTPTQVVQRQRAVERYRGELLQLLQSMPALRDALRQTISSFNGTRGQASSFDGLHELLECQCYRLAYWRVAAEDINYRRFFDVNDLAALRMDNEAVFAATHGLVFDLIETGMLDGVRLDHPDGLYDPAAYFARLQAGARQAMIAGGRKLRADLRRPLYLLVEKITASFEQLPRGWPVHGTTGYNFANAVGGLLVDTRAKASIDRIYRAFVGDYVDWEETAHASKVQVLRSHLAAELNVLANQLARIAQAQRHTRDFTLGNLRQLLIEIIAAFPVYRTYVTGSHGDDDRRYVDWALARARGRSSAINEPLLRFMRAMMLAEVDGVPADLHAEVRAFAGRLQQVTSPVAAKGVEDTALYRFVRLVSLNEVGGEPERFGTSTRQFHAAARHRARRWPHELLSTSTHDTKRSEDVRARVSALSEMPANWRGALRRWSRMNRSRRRLVGEQWAPGPQMEYLYYQTLLGTWPLQPVSEPAFASYRQRIEDYMLKAAREAKRRTAWMNVNEPYEAALLQFIRLSLDRYDGNLFPPDLEQMAGRVAHLGCLNSLAQTLCKLTSPGVPDIYQGNEILDWSLVDPDNRRPVDYALRRRLLDEVASWRHGSEADRRGRLQQALEHLYDGRAKLHVTHSALEFRRDNADLFRDGSYLALRTGGQHRAHVIAYARRLGTCFCLTVVPRLCHRLLGEAHPQPVGAAVWGDTHVELPGRMPVERLHNLLDGREISPIGRAQRRTLPVADILALWPCALLASPDCARPPPG